VWTYGTHGRKKGYCWLKGSAAGRQRQSNRESGRVCRTERRAAKGGRVNQCVSCRDSSTFLKRHDYQGSDLIRGGVSADSPDECCKKCRQNSRCRYWTYGTHNPRKGRCWLKKNTRGSQSQSNRESGRVCKKNRRTG